MNILRSCFEFIAQSTHENGYIKPRKTFWRNSKQLLNKYLKMGIVWRPWIVLLCKQKQYEFIFCYV